MQRRKSTQKKTMMNNHSCEDSSPKVYFMGQEVDPCQYREIEKHENVTVAVLRCKKCGRILLEWFRTPETVSHYYKEENSNEN